MRHPGPDELVDAALSTRDPDPGTEAHLRGCPTCRAEVEALRGTAQLAREGADRPLQDPPPTVWERVVDELGPDLDTGPAAAPAGPGTVTTLPSRRRGPLLLAAAALVVGLAGGVGIGLTLGPGDPEVPDAPGAVPLVALDPGSGATGSTGLAEIGGRRILTVALEHSAVPAGGYLEAWLMDEGATRLYALGGLTAGGPDRWTGRFVLPADLPLDVLDTVDVSVEHFDGNPGHSGESLARGRAT
ncbi:hypothetical protein GCM10010472_53770 [Pseudonocardia halophobica]|uniref:Anti-sigma K factor RskA C-terminal domain-containing protein n=1 Tax=Pseudonocardia halophobica TaxID=29401 RepID=A0A9W6NWC7_9PSEU|nr:anti-sigma factor [Pseudonocardia halophobica]GLL11456.1 hypothetical protein GCM10017577_25970 [Pseudonocardia halophobica]